MKRIFKNNWVFFPAVIIWGLFFSNTIQKTDFYLNPVYDEVILERVEDRGFESDVYGNFVKLRDCDFLDIQFIRYIGSRPSVLQHQFLEANKVRDEGYESFGPWRLQASREQILTSVEAVTQHRCYFFRIYAKDENGEYILDEDGNRVVKYSLKFPWKTVGRFYP